MNDHELRDSFRSIAAEDAKGVPSFSRTRIDAQRSWVHLRRRRVWFTTSGIAVAAAAALMFEVLPRRELLELDLTGMRMVPATDFLLNTPGRSLMRTVPSIGITTAVRRDAAPPLRDDTSRREQ